MHYGYDTNNNNKYDKKDKNEIHIYDLLEMKLIKEKSKSKTFNSTA